MCAGKSCRSSRLCGAPVPRLTGKRPIYCEPLQTFGFLARGLRATPTCAGLATSNRFLGGLDHAGRLALRGAAEGHLFRNEVDAVAVVWSDEGRQSIALADVASASAVTGERLSGPFESLRVEQAPVFVKLRAASNDPLTRRKPPAPHLATAPGRIVRHRDGAWPPIVTGPGPRQPRPDRLTGACPLPEEVWPPARGLSPCHQGSGLLTGACPLPEEIWPPARGLAPCHQGSGLLTGACPLPGRLAS